MRVYEVYYSDMQVRAKFKTLQPDTAENFVSKYAKLPKVEYMRLVLETCVHNFRSDVLYSLAKMSKEASDEALMSMYNGCIMLNPTLDTDTWSNITYSFNYFKQGSTLRELEPPQFDHPNIFNDEDIIPDEMTNTSTSTRERRRKNSSIPPAKFANLENHLNSKIIGQKQAVHQVVSALKRSQAQLNDPTRPLGVFLFAGPSGVGKTLIAKELQKYLFQGDPVRIDCGEYQHKHENQKLIGCFPAGELVHTDQGIMPIEKVDIRSLVLTHEGDFKKVICKHIGLHNDQLIKITAGNTSFTCTLNHDIYAIRDAEAQVPNAKFYRAAQLQVGDLLVKPIVTPKRGVFKGYTFHKITSIDNMPYKGKVYDLTVEKRSTYTVSGFVVHNSPPGFIGHDEGGILTREIGKNPQTILLLDEAEKAHQDFWHTFLQTFDEGFMTDNKGNRVSFKETIIILTSNLGNDKVSEATFGRKPGFSNVTSNNYASKDIPKREMVERETYEAIRKHFKPEFLNRLDEIVVFNHLESDNYKDIAEMEFQQIADKLSKQGFNLEWDQKAVELLVDMSSKAIEGARSISKVRREHIETQLADILIKNKYKKGTIFTVLATDDNEFQIVWSK